MKLINKQIQCNLFLVTLGLKEIPLKKSCWKILLKKSFWKNFHQLQQGWFDWISSLGFLQQDFFDKYVIPLMKSPWKNPFKEILSYEEILLKKSFQRNPVEEIPSKIILTGILDIISTRRFACRARCQWAKKCLTEFWW